MTVFVCVDDNKGMTFNARRQSRDSELIKKVMDIADSNKLWINSYSEKLFKDNEVCVDENFLEIAQKDDFCFVENVPLAEYDSKIEKLILFKWNKVYPSDKKLDLTFENRKLDQTFDFKGSSHDKITCEVWIR